MIRNTDLAAFVAEKHEISESNATAFIDAAFALIQDGLSLGEIVKVKGLGTFKVMQTKERESVNVNTGQRILLGSRPKVIFTPDMVLRERVNAPFAGFSSVPLSDGVVVDAELSEADVNIDESISELKQESDKSDLELQDTQTTSKETKIQVEPQCDNNMEAKAISTESKQTVANLEGNEAADNEDKNLEEDSDKAYFMRHQNKKLRVWVATLAILLVVSLCACGFLIWRLQYLPMPISTDSDSQELAVETVSVPKKQQAVQAIQQKETAIQEKNDTIAKRPNPIAQKVEPKSAQTSSKSSDDEVLMEHPFQSSDSRVKHGAYYIIGTSTVVTVQQGQTFESICRAYLGNDMECYVEVYNGMKTANVGDKIRIPKLITKKAWQKKMNK